MQKGKQAELKVQRIAQGIRREQSLERRETDVEARLEREERASSMECRSNCTQKESKPSSKHSA